MNDSQLPAEISPKHSKTRGEGDEMGKPEVEEGEELRRQTGASTVVMKKKCRCVRSYITWNLKSYIFVYTGLLQSRGGLTGWW